jgi:hypothetical protein
MIFGDKKSFAFEYEILPHPYGDEFGIMKDSWGLLRLWVKNVDILEIYRKDNDIVTKRIRYEWNLIKIVEWLSNNFNVITQEENFPNSVLADNSLEYIKLNNLAEPDMDTDKFWFWNDNAYKWLENHWFGMAADDSHLGSIFIRKKDDSIEISWDNNNSFEYQGLHFISVEGVELIPIKEFKEVIYCFIKDFTSKFQEKYPNEMKEILMRLQKH